MYPWMLPKIKPNFGCNFNFSASSDTPHCSMIDQKSILIMSTSKVVVKESIFDGVKFLAVYLDGGKPCYQKH